MKKWILSSLLFSSLSAFDGDPWVIEPLKPELKALYSYGFFSKVHGYHSNFKNNQLLVSLDVAFPNHFQLSIELDQDGSSFESFYFRDAAVEIKKQFLDDVAEADPFSMATGIRGIAQTTQGRLDPATLYPGGYHFEGFLSIGKEWTFESDHFVRTWAVAGLGVATHSSPWAELDGYILYRNNKNEFKVFAESALGYGSQLTVSIPDFTGWGPTRYRYLDLGFVYGYEIVNDFFIKLSFAKRSLSKVMPRNYNYYSISLDKVF